MLHYHKYKSNPSDSKNKGFLKGFKIITRVYSSDRVRGQVKMVLAYNQTAFSIDCDQVLNGMS